MYLYTRLSTYYNYKAELLLGTGGGGGLLLISPKNGSQLSLRLEHVCRINKMVAGFYIAKVNLDDT